MFLLYVSVEVVVNRMRMCVLIYLSLRLTFWTILYLVVTALQVNYYTSTTTVREILYDSSVDQLLAVSTLPRAILEWLYVWPGGQQ